MKDITFSPSELRRYSRHLMLPQVGAEGQQKLKEASVLIIGAGGLGSPASLYLAAAGVGTIGLVDHDVVDESNLQRQVAHGTSTLGERKVDSARAHLLDINPHITVNTYDTPFTSENALQIARPYDILLDGTDNFPSRYLSNDVCVLLGKPNVFGSVYRFEGQASVFYAKKGPCYRCAFPTPPPPHAVPTCAEVGVFGILPGVIGLIQATEALKLILGIGEPLIGRFIIYDALSMTIDEFKIKKNPACPVCSEHPTIDHLIDYDQFCGFPNRSDGRSAAPAEWEISAIDLSARLKDPCAAGVRLVDVREKHEWQFARLPSAESIPLDDLRCRLAELHPDEEIVLYCQKDWRAIAAMEILLANNYHRVSVLRGGLKAWAKEVDPSLPDYW